MCACGGEPMCACGGKPMCTCGDEAMRARGQTTNAECLHYSHLTLFLKEGLSG